MQTLLPTLNDLTLKSSLNEQSSRSPFSSATDRSSFAQIVSDTKRDRSSQLIPREDSVSSAAVIDGAHDRAAARFEDAQYTSPSRDLLLTGASSDQPPAPAAGRPAAADPVEDLAQNGAGSAQGLPADSALFAEGDSAQELDQQTNLDTIESAPSSIDRGDAVGEERAGEATSTTAFPAVPSGGAPHASAMAERPAAMPIDRAQSPDATPIPREAGSASRRPDDPTQRQPVTDSQVTDRSAGAKANQPPTPTSASTQSPQPPTATEDSRRPQGQVRSRAADQPDRLPPSNESRSPTPASVRAVQIDAAVRVENATGQPATPQLTVPLPGQSSPPSAVTAGTTPTLPTPISVARSADPNHDPFTARILRGLSATLNQRGGVLTMRLEPPELGQLRIQMTITQGTVSAEFQAATPQAQALLERSLAVLRSALQGHGLTVERLTVHTTQQVNAQATRQDATEQQTQQDRHHADAGKGESRGRRDHHERDPARRPEPRSPNEYAAFDISPIPTGAD